MLTFSTKAGTLKQLEGHLEYAQVLPQVCFTVDQWQQMGEALWLQIEQAFGQQAVIVRSSALSEDTGRSSQAGKFLSVADCRGRESILSAIEQVAGAFDDDCPDNEIFIQPMLQDVARSGVIFTLEPNTGGQYYVINYDDGGSTSSVTSGSGEGLQVYYQAKSFTAVSYTHLE